MACLFRTSSLPKWVCKDDFCRIPAAGCWPTAVARWSSWFSFISVWQTFPAALYLMFPQVFWIWSKLRFLPHYIPKGEQHLHFLSLSLPLGLSPNVTPSWFLNGQEEEPEVKWERGRAGDVMKSGREQGREEGIRGKRRRENGEEHEVPKKLNQLRYSYLKYQSLLWKL